MVDFKRLDTAENGDQEDLDAEQMSNEFADLFTESLKERPEKDKIIATTSSIIHLGVEAPAVTPTRSTPANHDGSISDAVSI